MRATRNYLDTIRKALENWQEWSESGDKILEEKGWLFLHGQLNIESRKIRELDVQEVTDDILEHKDSIPLRLKRLEAYGIRQLRDSVLKIAGRNANLTDETINDQLTEYRSLIVVKTAELAQAYNECAAYLKPPKKKPKKEPNFDDCIQYGDKEKLKKRLHELIDGKSGADVGSVIFRAKFVEGYLSRYPTQAEFRQEFELVGTWSAIHNYFDENSAKAHDRAANVIIFQ